MTSWEDMKFGPLGDSVDDAVKHSEADPIGIYAAHLALFSSAISRSVTMENGRLVVVWTVLVGRSSLGRKGYALRSSMASLAPSIGDFLGQRIRSGISSGPSLVDLLYEQQEKTAASEDGEDGRIVLVEEEWASVLKIAKRCRTFSQKLRTAWDGAAISNRTKESYQVVSRPLLGLHVHITPGEWSKYVSSSDALGGTYNRVLPVLVERSKMLPYNHVPEYEENEALTQAYKWATAKPRTMQFAPDAGRRYDELRALIEERMSRMPESLSCYLERSGEQIVRVAAVLTAATRKTTISKAAVNAAWAFVQHSMRSVEELVTSPGGGTGQSVKEARPLPGIIRERLSFHGGQATSSQLLRASGIANRVNASTLRETAESMPDVEITKGKSASGRGAPSIIYRLVKEEATEEKKGAPEQQEPRKLKAVPAEEKVKSRPKQNHKKAEVPKQKHVNPFVNLI